MSVDPNIYRGRLTAEQAARDLADLKHDAMYRAGYFDKHHPLHDRFVEHTLWLNEVAAGVPAPEGATLQAPWTKLERAIPEQRILEAQKHPAYRDKFHPDHASIVERVSEAYRELYPETLASGAP